MRTDTDNPFAPERAPTWPPLILGGCERRATDLVAALDTLRWLPVGLFWAALLLWPVLA